ncbi:MAG: recombination protein RecR [Alphaproteobacteria bacterium]|nr:MAG: recombination protein RecR [Alphaproteobacteria bacterium]
MTAESHPAIEGLIQAFARLPGLGPRSARRIVLHLIAHKEGRMRPLARRLAEVADAVRACSRCGNLDVTDPCGICRDPRREGRVICVVEQVADLWALERSRLFKGRYHVLGGLLNALEGIGPDDINLAALVARLEEEKVDELILALPATIEGQTTAHYLAERLAEHPVTVSEIAHGVPVGGSLEYLDEGTLAAALKARHRLLPD